MNSRGKTIDLCFSVEKLRTKSFSIEIVAGQPWTIVPQLFL
jgi:hypothetical protein